MNTEQIIRKYIRKLFAECVDPEILDNNPDSELNRGNGANETDKEEISDSIPSESVIVGETKKVGTGKIKAKHFSSKIR